MEKAISAANANRKFSRLLRAVREGQSYIVTSHGKPVARIAPVKEERPARERAWAGLARRLRSERVLNIGKMDKR